MHRRNLTTQGIAGRHRRGRRLLMMAASLATFAAVAPPAHADSFRYQYSGCKNKTIAALGGGARVVGENAASYNTAIQETSPWVYQNFSTVRTTGIRNYDAGPHKIGFSLVCAAPPPGYEIVIQSTWVAAGGFIRTFAACPTGKVALTGGAFMHYGGTDYDPLNRTLESAPATTGGGATSGWLVAAHNYALQASGMFLNAVVVCAYPPPGYQIQRTDKAVAAGQQWRAYGTCPAGKVVLGAGSSVVGEGTADFQTSVQESAPLMIAGKSAHFLAVRNNDVKTHTIGFFVVCTNPLPDYEVVEEDIVVA